MLTGTLAASLLGNNLLAGKGTIRAGEGATATSQGWNVTYSRSYILQIAVRDYFLTTTFTNTTFQFTEYVKQS